MIKSTLVTFCLAVLALAIAPGVSGQEQEPRSIRVEGYAEIRATADQAIFEVQIITTDLDPKVSRHQNQQRLEALLEVVDGLDSESTTLATHSFVVERVNIATKFEEAKYETRCRRVVVIDVQEIDKAAELIDAMVDLSFVFEVDWRVEEGADIEKQGLALAVEDAKAKAELALQILDEDLGQALHVNVYSTWRRRTGGSQYRGLFGDDDDGRSTSNPGVVWLDVTVEISFEIGE